MLASHQCNAGTVFERCFGGIGTRRRGGNLRLRLVSGICVVTSVLCDLQHHMEISFGATDYATDDYCIHAIVYYHFTLWLGAIGRIIRVPWVNFGVRELSSVSSDITDSVSALEETICGRHLAWTPVLALKNL